MSVLMVFIFTLACRDEIAGCSEKAYDYLSINDAKQILMFSSDQELSEYITEVGVAGTSSMELQWLLRYDFFEVIFLYLIPQLFLYWHSFSQWM